MTPLAHERKLERQRKDAKKRRARRKAEGACLNSGPLSRVEHGPVVLAGRCQRCVVIWRRSK